MGGGFILSFKLSCSASMPSSCRSRAKRWCVDAFTINAPAIIV